MRAKNAALSLLAVATVDQITKLLFTNKEYSVAGLNIIKYTENAGAAFSILQGQRLLLIAVAIAALAALAYYTTKIREKRMQVGMGMLMGGIAGNLIDRVFLGYVRDFIHLGGWPTFNIADTSMVAAIALITTHMLKTKNGQENSEHIQDAA